MPEQVPLILADNSQLPIVIVAVVGLAMAMWVITRRRASRSSCAPRRPRSTTRDAASTGSVAGRQELHQSMQDLLLQLEELSREINSQVDTRLRALNLLVQEADEKIRLLKKLQGGAGGEAPSLRARPPTAEPRPDAADERYARVYALADSGSGAVEIAREMQMMTGEVELILALRRTAGSEAEDRA